MKSLDTPQTGAQSAWSRRSLLRRAIGGAAGMAVSGAPAAAQPWPAQSDLKITDVRLVRTRPRKPFPRYDPAPGSYWATREAARPIMIHPEYTGKRGPDRVYKMFEEQRHISRGPEGVYIQPSEEPGFGWDFEVSAA